MKKLMLAMVLLIALIPSVSKAQNEISGIFASHHQSRNTDYNEKNYGLFYTHYGEESDTFLLGKPFVLVGAFENSEYRTSGIVGFGVRWQSGWYGTSLMLGLATGYEANPVTPGVAFGLHLSKFDFRVIPDPMNGQSVFTIGLSVLTW